MASSDKDNYREIITGDKEDDKCEKKNEHDDDETEMIKMTVKHEDPDDDDDSDSGEAEGEEDVTELYESAWIQPNSSDENQDDQEPPKKKACFSYERDATVRKRQCNKLLRRLKLILDEFSTRLGQQVAIIVAQPPTGSRQTIKTYGSDPLQTVISRYHPTIMTYLAEALSSYETRKTHDPSRFELPRLVVDGVAVPIEKMTQAQLREFIPIMLRYSTGRGKPGWGKDKMRPEWWPADVPWSNVRVDSRDFESKSMESWSSTLRRIIVACYRFHGRDDLLSEAALDPPYVTAMNDNQPEEPERIAARPDEGNGSKEEPHSDEESANNEGSIALYVPKNPSDTRHVILTDAHGQEYCVEISVPNNSSNVMGNYQMVQQSDVNLQEMTLSNGQVVALSN